MTDPHDLDELASAQLDGTTSPEEATLLAADPALRAQVEARAEELGAVRRALAAPTPVDPAHRDAAIRAALAAFDEDGLPASAGATVTPLAPRRGMSPRAVRALSAAAVILLLALLVPLLANIQQSDDDTATFESTGAAIGDAATDGAESEAAQDATPTTTAGPTAAAGGAPVAPATTLGVFDDLDALAAAVESGVNEERATDSRFSSGNDARCDADPGPDTVIGVAVVAGQEVEVYVTTAPDGPRTMTVRASATCELLDEREL